MQPSSPLTLKLLSKKLIIWLFIAYCEVQSVCLASSMRSWQSYLLIIAFVVAAGNEAQNLPVSTDVSLYSVRDVRETSISEKESASRRVDEFPSRNQMKLLEDKGTIQSFELSDTDRSPERAISVGRRDRRLLSTSGTEKEVVTIVIYDNIKGYLNWMQDWFLQAAKEKCSTICIVSDKKGDVSVSVSVSVTVTATMIIPASYLIDILLFLCLSRSP